MTIAKDLNVLQSETEFEQIEFPPGDLESKEPPLESYLHLQQLLLLLKCLDWFWQDRNNYSLSETMTKFRYYSQRHLTRESGFGPHFSEFDSYRDNPSKMPDS